MTITMLIIFSLGFGSGALLSFIINIIMLKIRIKNFAKAWREVEEIRKSTGS